MKSPTSPSSRRFARTIASAALAVGLAGVALPSDLMAQGDARGGRYDGTTGGRRGGGGGGGEGRGSRAGRGSSSDIPTARAKLMEKEAPTEQDFTELVTAAFNESVQRKLPSFFENPEASYGPELIAFRREVYGPLLDDPKWREFLRQLAAKPLTSAFGSGTTAALVLADAPVVEDLQALFDGYQKTGPDQRTNIARQLGRAIDHWHGTAEPPVQPRPALVDEVLAQLRADAAEGKASQRGAALEGLFRAGEADAAIAIMKSFLTVEGDPLETVTFLQASSRLFQKAGLDPLLKARAIATAHAAIETLVADDSDLSPTQVISGKGRTLRAAVSFLQEVAGAHELDLLLRCIEDSGGQRLLGMDGLQSLRFGLQNLRSKLPPERAAQIDDLFLRTLADAGTRLFSLEEEPLTEEEQRHFWEQRDLRYNALSYFCDQFLRNAAVKERLGKEPDLVAWLACLARARENVTEEQNGDVLWIGVADKRENCVMAMQLLARLERELNRRPDGLDLFAEALAIMAEESQAELPPANEIAAFRSARFPELALEIPGNKAPADAFVRGAAAQTIANLGFIVSFAGNRARIEPDAEHPWPWAPDGSRIGTAAVGAAANGD